VKSLESTDNNRSARVYWSVMVAAGTLTGVWAIYQCLTLTPLLWAQFLALLALAVSTSAYSIRLPNSRASLNVANTVIFLSVLLLGVPAAVVLAAVDCFVSSRRTTKQAINWIGAPAMTAITVFIAANSFYLTLAVYGHITDNPLRASPLGLEALIAPMAVMAVVQFLLNGFSAATLSALTNRRSMLPFWRNEYLRSTWTFLGSAMAATLLYATISRLGFLYILLTAPVILAFYATYRVYFDQVAVKTREAAEVSRLHLATLEALATAIDAKDQSTHCHVRRVQVYAAGMGRALGLPIEEIEALKAGALLHDIGKLAVPDHILNKPGRLSAAEFEKMKVHTTVGADILERVNFPYPVIPIVRHHHEQWDGRGYPDGLKGEQIPVTARIISVVDCFDAAREDRPFRRGMTNDEAAALLSRGSGTHFDPKIVDTFLDNLSGFEAEIVSLGLQPPAIDKGSAAPPIDVDSGREDRRVSCVPHVYEQIKDAHREVYALYEIARTFGSSLDLEDTLSILINKVGHIVPFDTCAVYLYDESKAYATAAHVAGKNADVLREHCVALGEGVTGFALANRRAVNRLDPMLDLVGLQLGAGSVYSSMAALPLFKDDRLIGALSVYSMQLKEYTDDHMRLLETVTRLASDALANAMHHAEAESNALTDALTGLPNARCMHLRFDEESSRARRTGRSFQVIMLDLDHFKLVNDTFGHKVGDKMLREVARLVHAQLRDYDFLSRYAGDEFVAIVQDLLPDQVRELQERIEATVSGFALRVRPNNQARVGISTGSASFGVDGETLDQLLIAADQAMYRTKSVHREKANIEITTGSLTSPSIN
jgi:diguanylate cyclase (GGDEF)-like protein/putative nucleotidyltransferase with HDIG domain